MRSSQINIRVGSKELRIKKERKKEKKELRIKKRKFHPLLPSYTNDGLNGARFNPSKLLASSREDRGFIKIIGFVNS